MSIYGFTPAPSYRASTLEEDVTSALAQPMGLGATLSDQFVGGVLESYGLGTAIRSLSLPERATDEVQFGDTFEQSAQRRADYNANVLPEDAYKASPYYREGVQWDRGMTMDRAAALADAFDTKKVREHFAERRPVSSFIANLAGQAVDPVNYIPVAGPLVRAANVAKFGRLGGAIATGAVDAAANTALAAAATFDTRKSYGDEITWQSTVSDIAMAGLIGGAFGGVASGVGRYFEGRRFNREAPAREAAMREATERLSTLQNVQDARIALNSAIDGIARGDDVRISGNAADAIQRIMNDLNPASDARLFADLEQRADLFGSTSVGRFTDNRPSLVQDFEGALRDQVFAADPIAASRYTEAEAKFTRAQEAAAAIEEPLAARRQSDAVALIDPETSARLAAVEDELAGNVTAARRSELEAEQALIVESVGPGAIAKAENDFRIGPEKQSKAARKALATARQEFAKARREVDAQANRVLADTRLKYKPSVDLSPARAFSPAPSKVQAASRVAQPESYKSMAEQYKVNADDGSFLEQTDLDQVRQEGRITEEDDIALNEAQAAYDNGVAYGEALKAAVACII